MSDSRSLDPDFLDWAPPVTRPTAEALFDSLSEALQEYRRVRADLCAADGDPFLKRLPALEQAERTVHARLRALGWCPSTEAGHRMATRTGIAGSSAAGAVGDTVADWQPARAALALVDELAVADRDSAELVEHIQGMNGSDWREIIHAAQRCQGLIADALVVGAVELAVLLGIPDSQLPL